MKIFINFGCKGSIVISKIFNFHIFTSIFVLTIPESFLNCFVACVCVYICIPHNSKTVKRKLLKFCIFSTTGITANCGRDSCITTARTCACMSYNLKIIRCRVLKFYIQPRHYTLLCNFPFSCYWVSQKGVLFLALKCTIF